MNPYIIRFIVQTQAFFFAPLLLTALVRLHAAERPVSARPDPRAITSGHRIPTEGYADQPYIVRTDDGAWLCAVTTGKGQEGEPGQHVVTMRSTDQGRTWSEPVDVEPADGPEASYAVLLRVPYGRIYCFYNHNTDNVREVKREDRGVFKRVDSLGHYVFKFTDDGGRTWSPKRYDVPIRVFECDRKNAYQGSLRFFWNVGRPLIVGDDVLGTLHKVGAMGAGFFAQSEGCFWRSDNILTERDPEQIRFVTLPDGDIGLRTPRGGGRIAEEQSTVALSDGSLYCVYRTVDGWPACAYSRDGGHTWTPPEYASYTPGGRRIKNPRAANFVWHCSNGKFLYWFHNHGGAAVHRSPQWNPYNDRNPAWLCAGVERDTPAGKVIVWSQPEVLLYDENPATRISYPDLIEDDGQFFVTETQKTVARVHEIPTSLLEGLFGQFDNRRVATDGLVPDMSQCAHPNFSLDLWLQLDTITPGQALLEGANLSVATAPNSTLQLTLDGLTFDADRGVIQPGKLHHVVITMDDGPRIVTFVVDGMLGDGGDDRQFGWQRFTNQPHAPTGALNIAGAVKNLRLYNRPLRTSEAVGNFHAGPP